MPAQELMRDRLGLEYTVGSWHSGQNRDAQGVSGTGEGEGKERMNSRKGLKGWKRKQVI